MKVHEHADWLTNAIERAPCRKAIRHAVSVLKLKKVKFDTIAFCGASGTLFGAVLAARMGKEIILVRKSSDQKHSCHTEEGHKSAKRVLIIDDIVSSGKTLKRIMDGVRTHACKAKFVGAYFYGERVGCYSSPMGFVTSVTVGCAFPEIIFEADAEGISHDSDS